MVVAVPRVFEKMFSAAQQQSKAKNLGPIFARATEVAISYSKQRAKGSVGLLTKAEHALFDRLVYSKIRSAFGGSLRFAFSGGSPLGDRLAYFFDGAGVRIFEGYGLTETSPVLAVNTLSAWRPGTVGKPVAGTTIRLADDGEVLAKGPQVFQGYWKNDKATAEVLTDDGWFRTGDVGSFDADGYLSIVGRTKELIISGGFNVYPREVEDVLRSVPGVRDAAVVGTPSAEWGEVVTAYLELADEHVYDEAQLRGALAESGDGRHEVAAGAVEFGTRRGRRVINVVPAE